jgi:alpha-tubulin suppressor-like RCC1 family protein
LLFVSALPLAAAQPQVSAGKEHALALHGNGQVYAWGNNSAGELGVGDTLNRNAATPLAAFPPGSGVSVLRAGNAFSLALKTDGSVWAWGSGSQGRLGEASAIGDRQRPAMVPAFPRGSGVIDIAAGDAFGIALRSDGSVWTWGNNEAATLGNGTFNERALPARVEGLPAIRAIAAGPRHVLALDIEGNVWGWGAQSEGQLCTKDKASDPVAEFALRPLRLPGLAGITRVSAGAGRSLFVDGNGSVLACGSSAFAAVCHAEVRMAVPFIGKVAISGVAAPVLIAHGGETSYLLGQGGVLLACGRNTSGELGKGVQTPFNVTPTPITPIGNVIDASGGERFAVALTREGNVFAWGNNDNGHLGIGETGGTLLTPAVVRDLGRPLSLGLNPESDADGDGAPNGAELVEGTQPFTRDNDVFAETELGRRLFVRQQARDLLGREADPLSVSTLANALAVGTQSRPGVVLGFYDSSESQAVLASVVRLYFAAYLRVPDSDGLAFWLARRRAGLALTDIANVFATAPEFIQRYGTPGNADFVTLVYRNVLGREPDADGLAYWTGELAAGRLSRGGLLVGFSESAEYRTAIAPSAFVASAFAALLQQAPDATGFEFWRARITAGGLRSELIDALLALPQYRARLL